MKKIYIGAFSVMFAAFLWAFDGVIMTPWVFGLGMTDVPVFVFMLHATASLFLSYFYFTRFQELQKLDKKDWLAFILVAFFGGALGTMSIVAAITLVYSQGLNISIVLLLQKLQPVFAILLAYLFLKEKLKNKFYIWAVLALVGSYLLTFGFVRPEIIEKGILLPALLSLLAAFSFGASTVFSKKAIEKVSHGLGTTLRFFLTTVVMLIILVVVSIFNKIGINTMYLGLSGFSLLNWNILFAFIVIALTTGGTSIFIYYFGLKKITASRSTIYELVFPVSSILLEFFIHGKILSVGQMFGMLILIFSILKITKE